VDEYYNFVNEFPNSQHLKEAERMFKKAKKSIE
jgi:outer membrane protein assembly factor BamD (BamD/ComL family)